MKCQTWCFVLKLCFLPPVLSIPSHFCFSFFSVDDLAGSSPPLGWSCAVLTHLVVIDSSTHMSAVLLVSSVVLHQIAPSPSAVKWLTSLCRALILTCNIISDSRCSLSIVIKDFTLHLQAFECSSELSPVSHLAASQPRHQVSAALGLPPAGPLSTPFPHSPRTWASPLSN